MKKTFLLFLLCSFFFINIKGQQKYNKDKFVNLGLKVGFNSAIPTINLQTEYGSLSSETTNSVGYIGEVFMRLNLNRVYFQPELAYCLTKEHISIQTEDHSNYATFNINVNSLDASAIWGYNTVKEDRYGLSLFSGVKIKYAYEIDLKSSKSAKHTTDNEAFYNFYITTGLGVNVSNLFFDFRYDIALKKNDIDMTGLRSASYGKINLNRKANILSFSIGVLF